MVQYCITLVVLFAAVVYGQDSTTPKPTESQKYAAVCQEKYPKEKNVTAFLVQVGPLEACQYMCFSVWKSWTPFSIVGIDIKKPLGFPQNIEDGTRCAPDYKCLGGDCHSIDDIETCSKKQKDLKKIRHDSWCSATCIGSDEKSSTTVGVKEGVPCGGTINIAGNVFIDPGLCKSGKCYKASDKGKDILIEEGKKIFDKLF